MSKRGLILLNVLLWAFASFKILTKGISALMLDHRWWVICLLILVAIGFVIMFDKVSGKYARRIIDLDGQKFPFYIFISLKGFFLIAFMMTLGILCSRIPGMPESFFAFFYTGLGIGLGFGAVKFLSIIFRI